MTTLASGRLGGQYALTLVTDDIFRVSGQLHGKSHTIGSGSYEWTTKLLDYCAHHDGQTQEALNALYFEGDPTLMIKLHEDAQKDEEARPRRRVSLVVFIETDVLESENAIGLVTERVGAVLGLAGVTVTQLNVHYTQELMPEELRAHLGEIKRELGVTEHHNLRLDTSAEDSRVQGAFREGGTLGAMREAERLADEPAVQMGADPKVSDPSDRESVPQSPMTRPNK